MNRIQLIGNLGKKPDLRKTGNGKSVCSFSLATTESYKKQNSNEWEKSTTWWNVTVWGDRAEKVAKLLDKGSQVFVEGKGRMNSYKDKQGIDRQTMEVHADEVKLLAKVDRQESHDSGSEDAPMGINSLADDD